MNSHCFKTVFSKRLGALVAVGEHASSQGKATGASAGAGGGFGGFSGFVGALTVGFALVGLAWAGPVATALPTGGQVAQGTASISQSGSVMNINQSTAKAVVNWSSFDIGSGAKVNIVQPGADAVMLNRVTGANPSQIFGQLNANGQVVLVNPNGVLFGKDGSVNAGSFTASTLGISDANFMAGNNQFERNGSTAAIVNQGSIKTTGGYVALLGASVSNDGKIETQGGTAYLAAAETVKIPVTGSGRIKLELSPSSINAAVANAKGGTIVTEGGQVYMQAAALNNAVASIIQSGSIDTTGAQGGAVHLLADGGQIKVDGSITANSTGQDEQSLLRKGGDIVIGRDEETGVLAKATDVRHAKLESNQGFVETSGDYLKTDGIFVKAAEWLLDPSDITISNSASSNITGVSPADITPNGGAGTSSIVQVSAIQNSINAGTSVTIKTTNASNNTGAGNITIANALTFTNTGPTDATLSLIADNGITQLAGATITTDSVNSTKLVNVSMEAKGNYQGVAGSTTNSKGITLNSDIKTNGAITLTGTTSTASAAAVTIASGATIQGASVTMTGTSATGTAINGTGVVKALNGYITIKGTSGNSGGYAVTTNNAITASGDIEITATGTAKHGIWLGSNVTGADITSTGGNITIDGDTTGTVGAVLGVSETVAAVTGRAIIKAEKDITIKGKILGYYAVNGLNDITSNSGNILVDGYSRDSIGVVLTNKITALNGKVDLIGTSGGPGTQGVNINATNAGIDAVSYNVQGISASGNGVLLGTGTFKSTSTSVDSVIEGKTSAVNGTTGIKATAGTLNFDSGAGKVYVRNTSNSKGGVELRDGSVINTKGDVTFGRKDNGDSRLFLQGLKATADGGKLTFLGNSSSTNGVGLQDYAQSAVNIVGNNGAAILIDGTSTASGYAGVNMKMVSTISHSVTSNGAGGSITINGTSTLGRGGGVDMATITANDGNAINITGYGGTSGGAAAGEGVYIANAVKAVGGGAINIIGDAKGSGAAVFINTNGGLGVINADTGKVTIKGDANSNMGINNSAAITGGTVEMTSTSTGNNAIYTTGAIASTSNASNAGYVKITGTNNGSASALSLQGAITASENVEITGSNTNTGSGAPAVYVNKAVTAINGKIDITASTAGISAQAMQLASGAKLTGKTEVNLKTDTLSVDTSTNTEIKASTVTIKNDTAGTKIDNDNGNDLGGTGVRTLRLSNAELNRISAGDLVIGSSNAGDITVAQSTTSNTTNANITLVTGGNININNTLAVFSGKTLTLNGAGANSQITQNYKITATNLELLGDSATHALNNTGNTVGTLAAKVKSLDFKNASALTVGQVNNTTGIIADTGVSVTTQTGDLTLSESINNQTSGNVVVGAGVSKAAGDMSGGDIKTSNGKSITNTNGKTYLYTGSAAATGNLSYLNSSLSSLVVNGTATQNADTNVAYNSASLGIAGSTAPAQVMFREKVTIDTSTLVGTKLIRTYGDADTANAASAALFLATKEKLKGEIANIGMYETHPGGVNNIKIAKSAVIDSLTSSLSAPTYSTGNYLKAATHAYDALTSSKYTSASIAAGLVKVQVEKKAITLTGAIASDKVYDQTDTAVLTNQGTLTSGGATSADNKVMTGDVVSAVNTGAKFTDGKNVKYDSSGNVIAQGVTIQGLALTGTDKDNYTVTDASNVMAKITPKAITLTGATAADKVYDRTDSATLSNVGGLTGGAVNSGDNKFCTGDTVTAINSGAKLTEGKNVKYDGNGSVIAQSVTILGLALDGADKGNYTVTDASNAMAKITPRALNGSVSGVNTVYGTAAATGVASVDGLSGDDVFANQAVVLNGLAYSSSGNLKAGTYTQSVAAGLGGADAGNYTFAGASSSNYVVNKLALTTQIADVSTTYGTAAKTGAASVVGALSGDKVDLTAAATLVGAAYSASGNLKAGSYQQTVGASLTGTDADNYTAAPTSKANYVVTPKAIAATVTAADKVYDGNNVATLNANSADILSGDVVNVTGVTGTFASKNVARDGSGNVVAQAVTVSGSGANLGGADGANYTLTNATSMAATTAKITPKDLTVTGITAADKVYDGSTTAALNTGNSVLAGVVAGDGVGVSSASAVGNFASKNVAFDANGAVTSQAVTVSSLSLNGQDAGNYTITDKSAVMAKVLQRALSITGSVAQDKTVDGTTLAQVTPGQLGNLVAGESLLVTATGQFADAEIGTNKAVSTKYALANGSGIARNYTAPSAEVLRAAILAANTNPLQPVINPAKPGGSSRVVVAGSSSSGAALGVAEDEDLTSREECSILNPEKCECQESTIAGVELCFTPGIAMNTKE